MKKQVVTCDTCGKDCTDDPFTIDGMRNVIFDRFNKEELFAHGLSVRGTVEYVTTAGDGADLCRDCYNETQDGAIREMLKVRPVQESEFEPEPFCYVNVYRCLDGSILKGNPNDSLYDAEVARRGDTSWIETVPLYRRKAKPEVDA